MDAGEGGEVLRLAEGHLVSLRAEGGEAERKKGGPGAHQLAITLGILGAYLVGYACLAQLQGLDATTTLTAYAWSWLENQIAAAIKLVPLGQSEAHQALARVAETLPAVVAGAERIPPAAVGHALPGLSLASAQHEAQYSRLFRS